MHTDLVDKAGLCAHLGRTYPWLDRYLKSHSEAPVVRHGNRGGGWLFSKVAWDRHLGLDPRPVPVESPPPIDQSQLRDAVRPPSPEDQPETASVPRRAARHSGEATARQRKDEADARLKEMQVAKQAAKLMEAETVHQGVSTLVASLGAGMDAMPGEIVKRGGLPEELEPVIREIIDDLRRAMVRHAEALFTHA